jgi:hypothetical protein
LEGNAGVESTNSLNNSKKNQIIQSSLSQHQKYFLQHQSPPQMSFYQPFLAAGPSNIFWSTSPQQPNIASVQNCPPVLPQQQPLQFGIGINF